MKYYIGYYNKTEFAVIASTNIFSAAEFILTAYHKYSSAYKMLTNEQAVMRKITLVNP